MMSAVKELCPVLTEWEDPSALLVSYPWTRGEMEIDFGDSTLALHSDQERAFEVNSPIFPT